MNGVREFAFTCSSLFVGAALSGCAAQFGQSNLTASNVFASVDIGAVHINADSSGNSLEVEEDTSASVQLGLGYQANKNIAVELRAGDFGAVEFTDGRELTYRLVDVSGLWMWRLRDASIFGRLGFGTFDNEGDFDVELESPVHAVLGGGVAYHALPNLDLRLSITAHGDDAIVGSAGLVWRFGTDPYAVPRIATVPVSVDTKEGASIEPVAPEEREELAVVPVQIPEATNSAQGEEASGSLVVIKKPVAVSQTIPEPVVPSEVTASVQAELDAERARLAALASAPVVDAVNTSERQVENLFVVDTLLNVRPILFASGGTTLLNNSATSFSEVLDILKENPELQLQVESHAAPVGNAELNMLLSRRRALTVIRLLVDQGIEAVRLRPRAYGDTAPIADADFMDENDRVEFRIR